MPYSLRTKIPMRVDEVWGIKLNNRQVNIALLVLQCARRGEATVVDPGTFYRVQFTPLLFSWGSVKYPYMTE